METSIVTKSEQETIDFAKKVLKEALKEVGESKPFGAAQGKPLIFYLTGELGAGKTHFVKGLAEGLGITDNITSPTFVLVKKYGIPVDPKLNFGHMDLSQKTKKIYFFHIDCYRIYDSEDGKQIGLDKIFKTPGAIIAIEWAERIADVIPLPYWKVELEHVEESKRRISVERISNF